MELLAVIAALSAVTYKIVERIRSSVGANVIDGNWVSVLAVVIGSGLLYLLGVNNLADLALGELAGSVGEGAIVRDLPDVVNYIVGGVFLASGSGVVADVLGGNS